MSLINDALKRARQTHQANPLPTPPLQFRPVEPGETNPTRAPLRLAGLMLALILIVALGGLVAWFVAHQTAGELRVAAKTTTATTATAPVMPPVAAVEPLTTALTPATVALETNPPPATVTVEPTKPPMPKLQGITFHPTRPIAVVNGKTVVLGDRVGGFQVLAITRDRVTLSSATATNVLSLSD